MASKNDKLKVDYSASSGLSGSFEEKSDGRGLRSSVIREKIEGSRFLTKTGIILISVFVIAVLIIALVIVSTSKEAEVVYVGTDDTDKVEYIEKVFVEERQETIVETVPVPLSFSEYFTDLKYYDGKTATVKGRLSHTIVDMNAVFKVVDDVGYEIILLYKPSVYVGKNYKDNFIINGTTESVFEVSGEFEEDFDRMKMFVTDIVPSTRTFQNVSKTITIKENVTRLVPV